MCCPASARRALVGRSHVWLRDWQPRQVLKVGPNEGSSLKSVLTQELPNAPAITSQATADAVGQPGTVEQLRGQGDGGDAFPRQRSCSMEEVGSARCRAAVLSCCRAAVLPCCRAAVLSCCPLLPCRRTRDLSTGPIVALRRTSGPVGKSGAKSWISHSRAPSQGRLFPKVRPRLQQRRLLQVVLSSSPRHVSAESSGIQSGIESGNQSSGHQSFGSCRRPRCRSSSNPETAIW